MSPGILGQERSNDAVFRPDGQVVPVTLLKAGPCVVVPTKNPATDQLPIAAARPAGVANSTGPEGACRPRQEGRSEGVKFLRELNCVRVPGT